MLTIFAMNTDLYCEADYAVFYLRELSRLSNRLVVCTSNNIEKKLLETIKEITEEVFQYKSYININRWKDVLCRKIGRAEVENYERVLLADDSVFGPFFSLDTVFQNDKWNNVDFWGMTSHEPIIQEKSLGMVKRWPRFIQSYFMVFNYSLLKSDEFWDFFQKMPFFRKYDIASEEFEFSFTGYLEQKGFCWDCWVNTRDLETADRRYYESFILFEIYELVSKRRFPFIPKYDFELEFSLSQIYHRGNDVSRAFRYIQDETEYNEELIISNLLHRMNLHDLIMRLNLLYVVEENSIEIIDSGDKVGVFAYLYYEDLMEYSVERLMNIPKNADLFIATDGEEKKQKIMDILKNYSPPDKVRVLIHHGKGRDLSALLVTLRPFVLDYDIICFIHDKKSGQMAYSSVGKAFNEHIWENMLGSRGYVNGVLKLMKETPYIGILAPPMITHNLYFHTAIDSWTICFEKTKEVGKLLGLELSLDKRKNPVHLGSIFWCRREALRPLFEHKFTFDDFPDEPLPVDGSFSHGLERSFPYIAQTQGYCAGIILTSENAAVSINNYSESLNLILRELDQYAEINTESLWSTVTSTKKLRIHREKRQVVFRFINLFRRGR